MTDPAPPQRRRTTVRLLAYAVGPVLVATLLLLYLAAPDFYLAHVLEVRHREQQAVEAVTVFSAMIGGLLMLRATAWSWRQRMRAAASIIGLIALATLFFAGEEVSWGQTWFGWTTPESYRTLSGETNLHNAPFGVRALGSWFLALMFFALPGAWALRARTGVPAAWAPAVAEGPVVATMATGFLWRLFKDIYCVVVPDPTDGTHPFYTGFVDQINEQKEMLVAVSLLMYGLYRASALRRAHRASSA